MDARNSGLKEKLDSGLRDIQGLAQKHTNVRVRLDPRAILPQVADAAFCTSVSDHLQNVKSEAFRTLQRINAEAEAAVAAAGQKSVHSVLAKSKELTEENDRLIDALKSRKAMTETANCAREDLSNKLTDLQQRLTSYRDKIEEKKRLIQTYQARQRTPPVVLQQVKTEHTDTHILALNFGPASFAPAYVRIIKDDRDTQFVEVVIKPGAQTITLGEIQFFSDATRVKFTVILVDQLSSTQQEISNTIEIVYGEDPAPSTVPDIPVPGPSIQPIPPVFQQFDPQVANQYAYAELAEPQQPAAIDPTLVLAQQIQSSFSEIESIEEVLGWINANPSYTFESLSRELIDGGYAAEQALAQAWQVKLMYQTADLEEVLGWFRDNPALAVEEVGVFLREQGHQPRIM